MNKDDNNNFISGDFPVDIVYLWCDSSDKDWLERKNNELKKYGKTLDNDSVGECRFIDNNELKYSLRSLEKYVPWINRIFIITDNQVPAWLDTTNPKIRIVSHSEILPPEALPTFNASAIETAIHKIPGLSEHFLFANDDMFFGNTVDKSFFFDEKGLPIFRFSKRKIINKTYKHLYGYMISTAYNLVKNKFGNSFAHFPHHNIDAYRKSDIEKCISEFKDGFKQTELQKFREKECIQRSIYEYFATANGAGSAKVVDNLYQKIKSVFTKSGLDSLVTELKSKKLPLIARYNPGLFCLNDSLNTTDDDRIAMKIFLEKKFPEPSEFEKTSDKNAQIVICYHKDFDFIKNDILKPIHVGSALSDADFGIAKDNTGDNISDKNKYYSELTALYHLWKNSNTDYVGLMHYRRLLDLGCGQTRWINEIPKNIDEILSLKKSATEALLEDFDIILPMKRINTKAKSNFEYYKKKHYISDLNRVLELIKEKTPEMYDTAVDVLKKSNEMYLYNMFISKKEFLDGYANWLFDILFKLEDEIGSDVEKREPYQQRVYGFLSERLFTVYVEHLKKQGLRVKEVPVVYCETREKRYKAFMFGTKIYKILTKFGIRKPHWREQYGV